MLKINEIDDNINVDEFEKTKRSLSLKKYHANIEVKVKDMKRRYKSATIDFETLVRLTTNIDLVDGEKKSETDMENIITNLPAFDLQKILNNIDKLNQQIGLDNTLYLTCPSCNEEVTTFFRFGPEFFRPTTI